MRIGILGGTFDPIYISHLLIAEHAVEEADLGFVLFVPNGHPPHKHGVVASVEERYAMCATAIADCHYFKLSDLEMADEGYYYTADTLEKLQHNFKNDTLCLILGSDEALKFTTWHEYEKILKLAELIIVQRSPLIVNKEQLEIELPTARMTIIEEMHFSVSSTTIRERIQQGKTIRYMTPDSVIQYIKSTKCYKEKINA